MRFRVLWSILGCYGPYVSVQQNRPSQGGFSSVSAYLDFQTWICQLPCAHMVGIYLAIVGVKDFFHTEPCSYAGIFQSAPVDRLPVDTIHGSYPLNGKPFLTIVQFDFKLFTLGLGKSALFAFLFKCGQGFNGKVGVGN